MSVALSGTQKAAALVAQLDEERATKLLKSLSETEAVEIVAAMATLPTLAPEQVQEILDEFLQTAQALLSVRQGGLEAARRLLEERLGPKRAEETLSEIVAAGPTTPLGLLQRMDPAQVASLFLDEHPQIFAMVLSHLPAEFAGSVLEVLPEDKRSEIARRIATMSKVPPEAIQRVAEVLDRRLTTILHAGGMAKQVGGVQTLAAVLSQVDRSSEKQILASLEQLDPEVAEEVRNQMFVFDDVVNLDDRTLQRVLRNVQTKDLAVALKGVDERTRERFLQNMSERAAEDLVDEIRVLGPVRMSQVEAAQQAVVRVVREMEQNGEIVIARGNDDLV